MTWESTEFSLITYCNLSVNSTGIDIRGTGVDFCRFLGKFHLQEPTIYCMRMAGEEWDYNRTLCPQYRIDCRVGTIRISNKLVPLGGGGKGLFAKSSDFIYQALTQAAG